jgi:hypothetical protein
MKIVLIHSAQVTEGKKVTEYKPGKNLNIDDVQAQRLIDNGYAKREAADDAEDKDPLGGASGTGGAGGGGNQNPGQGGGAGGAGGNGAGGPNTLQT